MFFSFNSSKLKILLMPSFLRECSSVVVFPIANHSVTPRPCLDRRKGSGGEGADDG